MIAIPPALEDFQNRKRVGSAIKSVLVNHGITMSDFHNEIHVNDKLIVEHTSQDAGLSRTILNHMFPKEPSPSKLYHYTSLESLGGMASSAELRLYPIKKRIDEGGELRAFAKAHGLSGYLDMTSGQPLYRGLSEDLFYVSLTRIPPKDPNLMWDVFASGTGVRLEFEVEPIQSELRPVYYEQTGVTTLLADINTKLKSQGDPPFTPWTISRIGAFYLSSSVSAEDEVRLLVKRHDGGVDPTCSDGKYDYWPIPIGTPNPSCKITLIGIHAAPNSDLKEIGKKIANTAFASVSPTGP